MKSPKQIQENTFPAKIDATSKPPIGAISIITLIKNNTIFDHSQKPDKI